MLRKLIKHDFRATARVMLPLLAAMFSATLLSSLLSVINRRGNSRLMEIFFNLCVSIFVFSIVAVCVMCLAVTIYRFYRNLLREEGYLMMVLPVSGNSLVCSKLIVSTIWCVISAIVIALCVLFFQLATTENLNITEIMQAFTGLIRELREALAETELLNVTHLVFYVLEALILFVAGYWGVCLRFYAAVSLGNSFHSNRNLLSVVFYFALAWMFRFAAIMMAVFADTNGFTWYIGPETFSNGAWFVHTTAAIFIVLTLAYDAILYLITMLGLKRHLNLA